MRTSRSFFLFYVSSLTFLFHSIPYLLPALLCFISSLYYICFYVLCIIYSILYCVYLYALLTSYV